MLFVATGVSDFFGISVTRCRSVVEDTVPGSGGIFDLLTTNVEFAFYVPPREVSHRATPALHQVPGAISSTWPHPMTSEWVAVWSFCLFAGVLCAICACGGMFSRIYPTPKTSARNPLAKLVTPTVSDDVRTSGSSIEREGDDQKWEEARRQDGLSASTRGAHCILINGLPSNRINNKARAPGGNGRPF